MAKEWSQHVTDSSHSLELEDGVFTWSDPYRIAESLKKSAEASTQRKATPRQAAMSMLNFYINRAGKSLSDERKVVLEQAKLELKQLFDAKN